MSELYDGISMMIERSKEMEVQYGTIQSVGINDVTVSVAGAKTAYKMRKPADFNGGRGDSCSITRNPRTLLWELVEVRRNPVIAVPEPVYLPQYSIVRDWTPIPTGAISFTIPFSAIPSNFNNCRIHMARHKNSTANVRNVNMDWLDAGGVQRSTLLLGAAVAISTDVYSPQIIADCYDFRRTGFNNLNDVFFYNRTAGAFQRGFVAALNSANVLTDWRFRLNADVWLEGQYRLIGF